MGMDFLLGAMRTFYYSGDGCITVKILKKNHWPVHLKRVNFMVHALYLDKSIKKNPTRLQ